MLAMNTSYVLCHSLHLLLRGHAWQRHYKIPKIEQLLVTSTAILAKCKIKAVYTVFIFL